MFTQNDNPKNCSVHPTKFEPNQDITGIGISLSWAVTAGLALCLVIANYFVAYRPDVDPFGSPSESSESLPRSTFKPNPIDKQLLGWRLKRIGRSDRAPMNPQAQEIFRKRKESIRDAFTQCMLMMSDYQLITGLAVLISGYSQLEPGISIQHWERVIDLAWFSSITHLCCLTFLRDYFYRNREAQFWRIPGMIILITLLSVALIPSAHYVDARVPLRPQSDGSADYEYYKSCLDYAKCFWKRNGEGDRHLYYSKRLARIDTKKQNTIVSAVILVFGMTNRVWRLFETSSNVYNSARQWLGQLIEGILSWLLLRTESRSALLKALVYRPMLAGYLTFHVLTNILLSKAFEVWWLMIGLFWGFTNLIPIEKSTDLEWTFGQVIAALMLVAPVVTLIEKLAAVFHRKQRKISTANSSVGSTQSTLSPSGTRPSNLPRSKEDPGYDFYTQSISFVVAVYVIVAFIAAISLLVLVVKAVGGGQMRPLEVIWAFGDSPNLLCLVYAHGCILCSLPIDQLTPESRFGRVAVGISSFILYAGFIGGGFAAGMMGLYGYYGITVPFGTYLVLFAVEQVLAGRLSNPSSPLAGHVSGGNVSLDSVTAATSGTPQTSDALSFTNMSLNQVPGIDTGSASQPPQSQDTDGLSTECNVKDPSGQSTGHGSGVDLPEPGNVLYRNTFPFTQR